MFRRVLALTCTVMLAAFSFPAPLAALEPSIPAAAPAHAAAVIKAGPIETTVTPPGDITTPAVPTPTAVRIAVAPSVVAYEGKVSVTATLVDASGTPVPGKRVAVQTSSDGSTWTTYGTLYSTTGRYATSIGLVRRTCLRIAFPGDAGYTASTSPVKIATARVSLTTPACSTKVYKGKLLPLSGYIKPKHKSGQSWVTIQADQYVKGTWKRIKTFTTSTSDNYSYSKYAASIALPYVGKWRIRAAHSCTEHAMTYTGYAYVTVIDPTIRLSGTGSATTRWVHLAKGTHRIDVSCAFTQVGHFKILVTDNYGNTGVLLDVYTQTGSGTGDLTAYTDCDVKFDVTASGPWNIVIR